MCEGRRPFQAHACWDPEGLPPTPRQAGAQGTLCRGWVGALGLAGQLGLGQAQGLDAGWEATSLTRARAAAAWPRARGKRQPAGCGLAPTLWGFILAPTSSWGRRSRPACVLPPPTHPTPATTTIHFTMGMEGWFSPNPTDTSSPDPPSLGSPGQGASSRSRQHGALGLLCWVTSGHPAGGQLRPWGSGSPRLPISTPGHCTPP